MARDPRASKIDDDPFDRLGKRRSQDSPEQQRIRVVIQGQPGNPFEPFMRSFFDVGGSPVNRHTGSMFHFSEREVKDLAMATGAFALAIAIVMHGGFFGMMSASIQSIIASALFSLVALAPAFIFHELAHKFMAKHYGCWAEFRADPRGLKIGLAIALIIGFVFMAPGAVMVAGRVTKRQNGIIAIVGPITNIVLFIIGLVGGGVLIGIIPSQVVADIVVFWLYGNAILAAFNMLPFGPLDGAKVKAWSEPAFWSMIAICVTLVISVFGGYAFELLQMVATTV